MLPIKDRQAGTMQWRLILLYPQNKIGPPAICSALNIFVGPDFY
jgi:hypothetical protein